MKPGLRTQRLRLPWLLALPFLFFARPTSGLILAGFSLALPGLLLRVSASGYIDKDRALAVHGPYAHLRHPLYLGSFLAGMGLVVGGGVWLLLPVFVPLFLWLYLRAARAEEREMAKRFGEAFREYRRRVPAILPSVGGREDFLTSEPQAFQRRLFVQNRGWDAPAGILGGFGLLWLKMVVFP